LQRNRTAGEHHDSATQQQVFHASKLRPK
jgi:hypothetical protein